MSRLDRHVHSVRNKLAIQQFIAAGGWTSFVLACACLLAVLIERAFGLRLPHADAWLYVGLGAAALVAVIFAWVRRPSLQTAAVAIDEKLDLKEKFSTALRVRGDDDPFARATVRDAEQTAENVAVNFFQHFPLRFPRVAYGTLSMAALALLAFVFLKPMDLFGREAAAKQEAQRQAEVQKAQDGVKRALAQVEAVPKAMADLEAVKQARLELEKLLKAPIKDPAAVNRSAMKAIQDANDAIKQQIANSQKFAATQDNARAMKNLMPDANDKGPVADAQRALSNGEYSKASEELKKLVENFDKLDAEQQQKAVQQMQKMAQALQQMAQNPQMQQAMQQQLQQMGMNPQQAQQMAQAMQQAAQGNPQAQQQMQQMAQQMMQQMNNGQGPNPQQQQQIQRMLQQMQAQQQGQQAQQQMAQAMQQMAQAMQQAQQQQRGQNQAGQQQGAQQMQQAMQQMQQQMQQMDAAAQDAQQMADAAAAMDQALQEAAGQCNNPGGDGNRQDGQLAGRRDGAGEWGQGDAQNKGAGMGGPGIGAGGRGEKQLAPFGTKRENSPSQLDEKGRILANVFIKDNQPIKGAAKADLKDIAAAAEQEAADEVDQERIGRSAQNVVKDYFGSLQKEEPAPAPPK